MRNRSTLHCTYRKTPLSGSPYSYRMHVVIKMAILAKTYIILKTHEYRQKKGIKDSNRHTQKQMSKDIQTSFSTAKSRHTLSIIRNLTLSLEMWHDWKARRNRNSEEKNLNRLKWRWRYHICSYIECISDLVPHPRPWLFARPKVHLFRLQTIHVSVNAPYRPRPSFYYTHCY